MISCVSHRLLEGGEADDRPGVCLPDHVPELLEAEVVGVLGHDEGPVPRVARHPAGIDIVCAGDRGLEHNPGAVTGHVIHAVVVKLVGGVNSGEVTWSKMFEIILQLYHQQYYQCGLAQVLWLQRTAFPEAPNKENQP